MRDQNFIVREPLLDPSQCVLGYELFWQQTGNGADNASEESAQVLIGFVAEQLTSSDMRWNGNGLLFMDATPALLSCPALQLLPAKNTVLTLTMKSLADDTTLTAVNSLREQGFGISLRNAQSRTPDKALLSRVTHIEVRCGAADISSLARTYAALKGAPSVRMVARNVSDWAEYDSCVSLGLDTFVGKLHLTPRPDSKPKGMSPSQGIILQIMDMVRKNADVRQLEGILKNDAALTYKLLRYINSVGFGVMTEVKSLRHAVAIIGYSSLYRWLSLLLATASTSGNAAVLMQTAIIRGRFAELLGQNVLPRSQVENLFVTGLFSLLDRLLGISMDEVMEHVQLPDDVSQALISRDGVYGPFLALAEACELRNGLTGALVDSVGLTPRQVNEAHLAALAWAQTLQV